MRQGFFRRHRRKSLQGRARPPRHHCQQAHLLARGAAGTVDRASTQGGKKGLSLGFSLSFPGLTKNGSYQVVLDYVLDDQTMEYRLCEEALWGGVTYEDG